MIMRCFNKVLSITGLTFTILFLLSSLAQAHLMVAQHGTINIVDDSAFIVMSLPMSAFEGIDDDGDGAVSMMEFNKHRVAITESLKLNLRLSEKNTDSVLQDMMLSPVVPHGVAKASISQLAVMGRFVLLNTESALRFYNGLYGRQAGEQLIKITATRQSDKQQQQIELTPQATVGVLFPDNMKAYNY